MLVACSTGAVCLPYFRMVRWLGDEGILLDGAQRMLHGDVLYRNFFEFLPPGGFLLTDAWFRIFGSSFISARIMAVLTIIGIACMTFLACRAACKWSWLSAAAAMGWVITSQGDWTVVTHHWFATLLSMIAAYVALTGADPLNRQRRFPFLAGLATGAAGMMVPTRGAYAMLAAFIPFANVRRRPARTIAFLAGGAVMPLVLIAYVVWQGALVRAFNDVIVFPATRYASIQAVAFGYGRNLHNLPLFYVYPAAGLLLCLLGIRDWRLLRDARMQTCAAFALAGLLGCYPRPDIDHIEFTAPLALPFLTFGAVELSRNWRVAYRAIAVVLLGGACFPAAHTSLWNMEVARDLKLETTPRGYITPANAEVSAAVPLLARIADTPKQQAYFYYPYMPMMPYLADRDQVGRYDIFTPDYTTPAQYRKACVSVTSHATWVVFDTLWTQPAVLKLIFPAMKNPRRPETVQFETILKQDFAPVAKYGTFELRHRLPNIDPAACAAIRGK